MEQTFKAWRRAQPEPAMRMPWWRELKWWFAMKLLGHAVDLMQPEMSEDGLRACVDLLPRLKNDRRFETVKMQPPR